MNEAINLSNIRPKLTDNKKNNVQTKQFLENKNKNKSLQPKYHKKLEEFRCELKLNLISKTS